jgi:hypothetical protein
MNALLFHWTFLGIFINIPANTTANWKLQENAGCASHSKHDHPTPYFIFGVTPPLEGNLRPIDYNSVAENLD